MNGQSRTAALIADMKVPEPVLERNIRLVRKTTGRNVSRSDSFVLLFRMDYLYAQIVSIRTKFFPSYSHGENRHSNRC